MEVENGLRKDHVPKKQGLFHFHESSRESIYIVYHICWFYMVLHDLARVKRVELKLGYIAISRAQWMVPGQNSRQASLKSSDKTFFLNQLLQIIRTTPS